MARSGLYNLSTYMLYNGKTDIYIYIHIYISPSLSLSLSLSRPVLKGLAQQGHANCRPVLYARYRHHLSCLLDPPKELNF